MARIAGPAVLVLSLFLAPASARAQEPQLTDAQAEALAMAAMGSNDPKVQQDTLQQLENHHFKSSLAPERERVLFVQGILEDRFGRTAEAAGTLHKLEYAWPRSPYLNESQVILADSALAHNRIQEAESRLRRALQADIPAEAQRRAQELLLWTLAEQGRSGEGAAIVQSLKPLGTAPPSERGLVGILEALCAAGQLQQAESAAADYQRLYPGGPYRLRVRLDLAKVQGAAGEAEAAGKGFQAIIQEHPGAPEADEARLALATLLTDGKLQPNPGDHLPSARDLLAQLDKGQIKEAAARQALAVRVRLALQERRWQEALDTVALLRGRHPLPAETLAAAQFRTQAVRGWAGEILDHGQPGPLLPYLDREAILSLEPGQRMGLAKLLAREGLPEAAQALAQTAPPGERSGLQRAALEATASALHPVATLALLPGKGDSPRDALARAQAEAALKHWPQVRTALPRAAAGPERVRVLVAYLGRPLEAGETPGARAKEVRGWLDKATEKSPDRDPLAILAADLQVRAGDYKGALALYPETPQAADRGWVALMRATCLARLGQAEAAKTVLKGAAGEAAFKAEREALGKEIGL